MTQSHKLPVDLNNGKVTITSSAEEPDPEIVVLAAYFNLIAGGDEKFKNNPLSVINPSSFLR
jgi:hypothetical protein